MSLLRVLPVEREWALFDAPGARAVEARQTAALPPHTLMRRAGLAVARLAMAIAPHAQRVWIAAGPGNNGGDGLEAAVHLLRRGWQVEVTLVADANTLPPDAAAALARATAAGVQINPREHLVLDANDIAIDALLGIGASRAPQGAIAQAILALNTLTSLTSPGARGTCPVLALDLPSGLHSGTGNPLGDACVVATHTLALLTLKTGLFTGAGRDHAGAVWFDSLGVDTKADAREDAGGDDSSHAGTDAGSNAASRAPGTAPSAWLSGVPHFDRPHPVRRHVQHKGSFGDVAVVGGAPGMTGAALLAARAAHAAGAGRVFVQLLQPASSAASVLSADLLRPELMFRTDWSNSDAAILARSTVVCGCGGGAAVREVLARLISLAHRLVLDADALNAVAADATLAALLRARADHGLASVLTPHPLEAARLAGGTTAAVQADRLHAAQSIADRLRCVVVLKGSGSVIAAPQRVARVNATGNAALASGGTGDVLAGWLAGLWAQAGADAQVAEVAARAVAEHGAAADSVRAGPLRAYDLVEMLHRQARARG